MGKNTWRNDDKKSCILLYRVLGAFGLIRSGSPSDSELYVSMNVYILYGAERASAGKNYIVPTHSRERCATTAHTKRNDAFASTVRYLADWCLLAGFYDSSVNGNNIGETICLTLLSA